MVNKRVRNAVLGCNLKNDRMISVRFQGKPFNITIIQVYAPTSNAEEAEAEWFYEDLQDLLELTPEKDVLFIIGDWNAKVGSQETPGVTGKFVLGILSPRVRLECNPEIPVAPGEEHWLLDTRIDEVYWPCSHSRAIPSFPSQLEWKIGLAWANTRGSLNSPS